MTSVSYSTFWLGEVPYVEALQLQTQFAAKVQRGHKGLVLGLEHPPVITTGLRMDEMPERIGGVPVVKTQRGGQATGHNPGQLVIYPILPLKKWGWGVREYVEFLLEASEKYLSACNIIISETNKGIFTAQGKIAAIGINVKKGVSTHGIAINISNDLSIFNLIAPCGIQNQKMDKVENYKKMSVGYAFDLWCEKFCEVLVEKGKMQPESPILTEVL